MPESKVTDSYKKKSVYENQFKLQPHRLLVILVTQDFEDYALQSSAIISLAVWYNCWLHGIQTIADYV